MRISFLGVPCLRSLSSMKTKNIVQSLIDGCLDSKTADRVFDVLAKAELFLDTLFFTEGSTFDKIFDSAVMAAYQTGKMFLYRRLLNSKAFGQVTWGASGNTKSCFLWLTLFKTQTSSLCDGEKGKHLCYYGINQLVIGNTEDGVKVLEGSAFFHEHKSGTHHFEAYYFSNFYNLLPKQK